MLEHLQNLTIKICFGFCVFTCFVQHSFSQTQYTVIDLGTLGGNGSNARGINDFSQVVGNSLLANGQSHAFLWDNGNMTDLGTLGGVISEALDINNSSQIVGDAYVSDPGTFHAFLWENGVMMDLGTMGGPSSVAISINDSTQIVGGSEGIAFLWENNVMMGLGTLGGNSTAFDINNLKQVAGQSFNGVYTEAFLWQNGQITGLGTLGTNSYARGINNILQIVGNSMLPNNQNHAFLWENGNMQDLGTLNGNHSIANVINDYSEVVGYYYPSSGGTLACIWDNGSAYDLNTLISPNSGWVLNEAKDINNRGEIVGIGIHNNQTRAFLLKPNTLAVTKPKVGDHFISGEVDTINWAGGQSGMFLTIEVSEDSGNTYTVIDFAIPADTGLYIWNISDTLLSAKAMIKISDLNDTTFFAESDAFKLKGYILARIKSDGNYEAFEPNKHGWSYQNGSLWPQSWWNQFLYVSATDPYTNDPYPPFFHVVVPRRFVDWSLWVEVSSIDSCYWSTILGIYKASAQNKWKSHAKPHNGSCFGFAGSSFLAFNFRNQFFTRHPGINNVPNIFSLPLDNTIQKTINGYYTYQYGKQSLDNDVIGQPKNARTTLLEVKAMLLSDDPDVRTISIYKPVGGGAHTMAPIKVVRDNSGASRYKIVLYDSNNPGLNTPYILIDSLNNTWTDSTGLGWGTGTNRCYLEIPVSNYLNTPTMQKVQHTPNDIDNIVFYNNEKEDIVYTSSTGNKIGFSNGVLIDEIADGIPIINKNGSISNPIGYYIPDDSYSIEMSNVTDTLIAPFLSVFKDNIIYGFERENLDSLLTDRFLVDGGFSVISPDVQEKQINLLAIAELDSSERILFINGTQLRQNDSVYLKELNQSEFIIKNYGSSKTYQLELNDRSSQEEEIFKFPLVDIQANSAQTFVPDWNDLDGSQLVVLIDLGIDGTIDDTLFLNNTVDVKDEGNLLSPKEYQLAQNYPNPFNPATTIRYSIPQRSDVILKVYDILGNEVKTLVNEEKERGVYTINFDGSQLASGIYFYRLQTGNFIETKKMILLK